MNWIILTSAGFFSLLIGSFLAMLAYRLPVILQNQTKQRAKPFNLFLPSSHCPDCNHALRFLEKLPIGSYFYLKGKCVYCEEKIHPRYLLIELATVLCSCIVIFCFDWNAQALAALILTWGLIVLSGIDFEHSVLPDILVIPLLWFGLILNVFHVFVSPESAILGACIAYISLWGLAKSYQFFAKKEGMGHGDFKCYALLGAWLGISALLEILLIASFLGLVVGSVLLLRGKSSLREPIPFGPYLAIAGWLVLLMSQRPSSL